jgi:hypothetical protein
VADRLVLALCALASCLLAFMLMLVTWSPFPADLIEGVQGRYFIAPALVLAYAAGAWLGPSDAAGYRAVTAAGALAWVLVVGALLTFAGLSMDYLAGTLQARYPAWAWGGLFR